ncbi:MAG: hypothetical protein ABR499_02615, partial [Gemmatimonadaceae bacterium]
YLLELAIDVELLPRAAGESLIEAADEVRRMLAALATAAEQGRRPSKEKGAATGRARPKY